MDSPKREPRTPACELQGSPLFKFLCSLSPIKQSKSIHQVQAYSELSFPSSSSAAAPPSPPDQKPTLPPPPEPKPDPSPMQSPASRDERGIPGGIGLHLNSLTRLLPRGLSLQTMGTSSQETHSDGRGNVTTTVTSRGMPASTSLPFRPNLLLSVIEKTRTDEQEFRSDTSQRGIVRSTTCVRSLTLGIQALEAPTPPPIPTPTPTPTTTPTPIPAAPLEMIENLPTPRKRLCLMLEADLGRSPPKRKRKSSVDKDGCKRCHCKKSKCLKLYCECFAAGVYCLDSCACQDCFNKPEFSETVLGTRQQIETRNPLAFAPKIIQTADCIQNSEGVVCPDPATVSASARHKRGCNCKKSRCLKKYCECYQVGVGCCDGCRCNGCSNIYGAKRVEPEDDRIEDGCGDFVINSTSISPTTPFQSTPTLEAGFSKPFYQSGFGVEATKLFQSPPQQPSSTRWQGLEEILSITPLAQHPERPTPASEPPSTRQPYPERIMPSSNSPATPSDSTTVTKSDSDDTPEVDRCLTVKGSPPQEQTPNFLNNRLMIKGGSPKQKRVIPPNVGGPNILRNARRLNLQMLPSLPPLTAAVNYGDPQVQQR